MLGKRHEIARLQSDFYRDSYHKLLLRLQLVIVLMWFLILGIIYFILFHPEPRYYATTTEGQIINMASLQR